MNALYLFQTATEWIYQVDKSFEFESVELVGRDVRIVAVAHLHQMAKERTTSVTIMRRYNAEAYSSLAVETIAGLLIDDLLSARGLIVRNELKQIAKGKHHERA